MIGDGTPLITEAIASYLADATARHLKDATIKKLKFLLEKQLLRERSRPKLRRYIRGLWSYQDGGVSGHAHLLGNYLHPT